MLTSSPTHGVLRIVSIPIRWLLYMMKGESMTDTKLTSSFVLVIKQVFFLLSLLYRRVVMVHLTIRGKTSLNRTKKIIISFGRA